METGAEKYRRQIGAWRCSAIIFLIAFLVTLIALVTIVTMKNQQLEAIKLSKKSIPCPPKVGGLVTTGDPESPGPFHDLTVAEYRRVYEYLRTQKDLNLDNHPLGIINASNIFMIDLLLPEKAEVLKYLNGQGAQPPRVARVILFRGDKPVPVVEEYKVGPLSSPNYHKLLENPKRRNSVPFAFRPVGLMELKVSHTLCLGNVDKEIGFILLDSYNATFTNCGDRCLKTYPIPVGTNVLRDETRKMWLLATRDVEYYSVHPLDFSVRLHMNGSDPSLWTVDKVWYSGSMYNSLSELATRYRDTEKPINKTKIKFEPYSRDLYSTMNMRGDPVPEKAQRQPLQVEPDGKRYTINHRHVKYLEWEFDFRLSPLKGPQIYDVRFRKDRIAYEVGLSEIGVLYSGSNPMTRVTDYIDSGFLLGTHSKSLAIGVDCPESATILNISVFSEKMTEPTTLASSMCVFELNTGVPIRRHMSYSKEEQSFYNGLVDNVLIFRSVLTVGNYDYVVDFIFRQTGTLEVKAYSTGYILSSFYRPEEAPYGFRLVGNLLGNIHHHIFHFKADVDILGTKNRYETVNIMKETVQLNQVTPVSEYHQTKMERQLRVSEMDALYKFNFESPKYHIVHNNNFSTKNGDPRAFRLHMSGMSKQLLQEGYDNENSFAWARHQLVVTVHNDDEEVGSSPYAIFDSINPVTKFTSFYEDNQTLVDQDLVFWVTLGVHHIPHTEDIPVTPTMAGGLSFYLLPYNYFEECPSMNSRDAVRVEYVTRGQAKSGLHVLRYGNQANDMCGAVTLEDLARERPDDILQTNRDFYLL